MSKVSEVRKAIKAELPGLKVSVRTVSFMDLARAEAVVVSTPELGICKPNPELYRKLKAICVSHGAILSC